MLSGEMSRCSVSFSCSTRKASSTAQSTLRSQASDGGLRMNARACFKVMPWYSGITM